MEQFGPYRSVEILVRTQMTTVHLARDQRPKSERKSLVVLKVANQDRNRQGDFRRMLQDEWELGTRCQDPRIIRMLEYGEDGEQTYIAMEYVHGVDLRTLMGAPRRRQPVHSDYPPLHPLSPLVALRIMRQACRALGHFHTIRRVDGTPLRPVHLDVKIDNFLVNVHGRVKFIDFGCARFPGRRWDVAVSTVQGSPLYMSPEQTRGVPLDTRSDIFSLGTMWYEMLKGKPPFCGLDTYDSMTCIACFDEATDGCRTEQELEEIHPALRPMLARCHARSPDDRAQSAEELLPLIDTAEQQLLGETSREHVRWSYRAWAREHVTRRLADPA